jgi:hypothetical protein
MSIEALSWGMKQDISTPTTKLVLIVLCNYANADNICYPSEKHLGMIVGVSERSVRRCIKNLKELGLIKIKPRNFKSNEYELLLKDTSDLKQRTPVTNNTKVDTKDNRLFDEFWKLYPRKVAKKKAEQVFKNKKEKELIIEQLKKHIQIWKNQKTEITFIPHPATWLYQERYKDRLLKIGLVSNTKNSLAG